MKKKKQTLMLQFISYYAMKSEDLVIAALQVLMVLQAILLLSVVAITLFCRRTRSRKRPVLLYR